MQISLYGQFSFQIVVWIKIFYRTVQCTVLLDFAPVDTAINCLPGTRNNFLFHNAEKSDFMERSIFT